MSKAPDVFNPSDRQQLTTAIDVTQGQTTLVGDAIRFTVASVRKSKAVLQIKAPDCLPILRGKLHGRESPPIRKFPSSRTEHRGLGLLLTLREGEWASVGEDVFVGVNRLAGGRLILGVKAPPGKVVCDENTWNRLNDPPRGEIVQS
jgi:sRNA-binding carbon storage regulator CsrA